MRILHAEDMLEYVMPFQREMSFNFPGIKFTTIHSIKQLKQLNLSDFDLIICDGQLEKGYGQEIIREARDKYKLDTIIVANSCSKNFNNLLQKHGADFVIEKSNIYSKEHIEHWKNIFIAVKKINELKFKKVA